MPTFTTNEVQKAWDMFHPGFKANCLQQMRIVLDIEKELAGKEDFLSLSIKEQIRQKYPAAKIISEVTMMAQDNYNAIAFLLGNKLTNEILNQ